MDGPVFLRSHPPRSTPPLPSSRDSRLAPRSDTNTEPAADGSRSARVPRRGAAPDASAGAHKATPSRSYTKPGSARPRRVVVRTSTESEVAARVERERRPERNVHPEVHREAVARVAVRVRRAGVVGAARLRRIEVNVGSHRNVVGDEVIEPRRDRDARKRALHAVPRQRDGDCALAREDPLGGRAERRAGALRSGASAVRAASGVPPHQPPSTSSPSSVVGRPATAAAPSRCVKS